MPSKDDANARHVPSPEEIREMAEEIRRNRKVPRKSGVNLPKTPGIRVCRVVVGRTVYKEE